MKNKYTNYTFFVIQAVFFTLFFQTFFYGNFKIPTGSMIPTLLIGDRLIVNKFAFGYSKYSLPPFLQNFIHTEKKVFAKNLPNRGDVVIFGGLKEKNEKDFYIKRVIGIPGDKIIINKSKIFLNGEILEQNFIDIMPAKKHENANFFTVKKFQQKIDEKEYKIFIADEDSDANNAGVFLVPDGSYFLMGDNRDNSLDSRFSSVSFIDFNRIVGKAEFIYFSYPNENSKELFRDRLSRIFNLL